MWIRHTRTFGIALGVACALGSAGVASAQCFEYELTIIEPPTCGPPFGIPSAVGMAINDEGLMTGDYSQCSPNSDLSELFTWTADAGLQTVDRPTGVLDLRPRDMNEFGQIVGWASVEGVGRRGYIFTDGRFMMLDIVAGATEGEAIGVNDHGHVVGFWNDGIAGDPPQEAVLWAYGEAIGLGPLLSETSSIANDINNNGDIVGSHRTIGMTLATAFLLSGSEETHLGDLPGGYMSHAIAINNHRQIIVRNRIANGADGGDPYHSFLWSDGKITDLGLLPGAYETYALDINDRAQVVGYSPGGAGGAAFLWQNGVMTQLDTFVPTTVRLKHASGINNRGQITGDATVDGEVVAFVLTPIGPLGDLDGDCVVDPSDLALLLGNWGPCRAEQCDADLDGDGVVGPADLAILLGNWG